MREKVNHMEYLEGMDIIESNMMEELLLIVNNYDYNDYTYRDVEKALQKERLSIDDYGAILSPQATKYLEKMAQLATIKTRKFFGNSVTMFTPLYISNYCDNNCIYCGFNCKNKIKRGMLTLDEVEKELKNISSTGLKEILLLTGESRKTSSVKYIGEAVKIASKYFSTVGIEVYPVNTDEYAYLHECGADFVSVYQETYNTKKYEQVHLSGAKRIYPYRFYAQERAILGGMRGVSFGALLGIDDFRKDAFAAGLHAYYVQKKYPYAEVAFSCPRLRPYINNEENNANDVHETQLLQVMLAYRLFMPFAGITISTRERANFRNNVIGMAATKISAGVKVSVGGHGEDQKGDEQFEISDPRNVNEVHNMILERGLQPVYRDYIYV